MALRDGCRLGLRTTKLLPDQALLYVGGGLARLRDDQRHGNHIYRRGRGGRGRVCRHEVLHDVPADRSPPLELPLDALRRALGDGELGALGGHHRVHVHEPVEPRDAPPRDGLLCRGLRHLADCNYSWRLLPVLRPRPGRGQLLGRPPHTRGVQHLARRLRCRRRSAPTALPGEGPAGELHSLVRAAAGLGRLLRGGRTPWVDAGHRHHLPGHVRPPRIPGGAPRRGWGRRAVGEHLAAPYHGRGLRPPRALRLPPRRALRQEDRETEEERISLALNYWLFAPG